MLISLDQHRGPIEVYNIVSYTRTLVEVDVSNEGVNIDNNVCNNDVVELLIKMLPWLIETEWVVL